MSYRTGESLIYLDYNATAPLLPAAREALLAALDAEPGNPSSPHRAGQSARSALEEARRTLARHLGCSRRGVILTSGGSEGNNMVLRWPALGPTEGHPRHNGPLHIITSPIEHASVRESCAWLESRGVAVSTLPVRRDGVVEVDAVGELMRPETRLVSVMAANNETGVVQPIEQLVQRVREAEAVLNRSAGAAPGPRSDLVSGPPIFIHSDAVQAWGRIALPWQEWGVDAVTVAAHKLGGPKGIGAVALRDGLGEGGSPTPWLLGGRQERGLRAGTESVALAAAFAAAADWVFGQGTALAQRLSAQRDALVAGVRDLPGFFLVGVGDENAVGAHPAVRLPNTADLGFSGVTAQNLLVALDLRGLAVSSGSACSSGAVEPSHVLAAMGLPSEQVVGALRFSLGHATTDDEVQRAVAVLRSEVARMCGAGPMPAAAQAGSQH